jgi:hypothetical protein
MVVHDRYGESSTAVNLMFIFSTMLVHDEVMESSTDVDLIRLLALALGLLIQPMMLALCKSDPKLQTHTYLDSFELGEVLVSVKYGHRITRGGRGSPHFMRIAIVGQDSTIGADDRHTHTVGERTAISEGISIRVDSLVLRLDGAAHVLAVVGADAQSS